MFEYIALVVLILVGTAAITINRVRISGIMHSQILWIEDFKSRLKPISEKLDALRADWDHGGYMYRQGIAKEQAAREFKNANVKLINRISTLEMLMAEADARSILDKGDEEDDGLPVLKKRWL